MLEPPDIPTERIIDRLWAAYGLRIGHIAFLPLGADQNTAVYRAIAEDGAPYFVKLRGGAFDAVAVDLPRFLFEQGVAEIIPPLVARSGRLSADLDPYRVIVYPYIEGRNGNELALSPRQWEAFGAAVRRLHTAVLPPALSAAIPRETYTPRWRQSLLACLERAEAGAPVDPVAAQVVAYLRQRRAEILDLVERTERFAQALRAARPPLVACHTDLHAHNILIDGHDHLYIVDWDDPILAPKERDLMFPGGAQGFLGYTAEEEERLFFRGYGRVEVDRTALAYYRYERIIQDLAIFGEGLLTTDEGGADRPQWLRFLLSALDPDGPIAMARRADGTLAGG